MSIYHPLMGDDVNLDHFLLVILMKGAVFPL